MNDSWSDALTHPLALCQEEIDSGRRKLRILLQGVFDEVVNPGLPVSFTVMNSEVAEEKHAFGTWDSTPVGSWIPLIAPSHKLTQDLTANRKVPLYANQVLPELHKAIRKTSFKSGICSSSSLTNCSWSN